MEPAPTPLALVVEDEPLVRLAIAEAARARGLETVEARTGAEAVSLLEAGLRPAVIFTDYHTPGPVNGLRLVQRVAELQIWAAVFLTSGQLSAEAAAAALGRADRFFVKPYDIEKVALALALAAAQP